MFLAFTLALPFQPNRSVFTEAVVEQFVWRELVLNAV